MSDKATDEQLGGIHGKFADWCDLILQGVPLMSEGKPVLKKDGQPWLIPPSAANMSIIRQFLKDNAVDSALEAGNPLSILRDTVNTLPYAEDTADNIKKRH